MFRINGEPCVSERITAARQQLLRRYANAGGLNGHVKIRNDRAGGEFSAERDTILGMVPDESCSKWKMLLVALVGSKRKSRRNKMQIKMITIFNEGEIEEIVGIFVGDKT